MLDYDRTNVQKGINVNKTDDQRHCIIFHYWYFVEINFRFHHKICDGCRKKFFNVKSCEF